MRLFKSQLLVLHFLGQVTRVVDLHGFHELRRVVVLLLHQLSELERSLFASAPCAIVSARAFIIREPVEGDNFLQRLECGVLLELLDCLRSYVFCEFALRGFKNFLGFHSQIYAPSY